MKKIALISTLLSAILLAGCGSNGVQPKQQPTDQQPVACTMEAKACPDGSYVGRSGPNCEFAACPTTGTQVACTEEAKLCPDGSSVARTGPNCEFAPCPTTGTGEAVSCGITPNASCAGTGK